MKNICSVMVGMMLLVLVASCSAFSDTVVDWSGTMKDGESTSWGLPEGIYRLEMTATGDGASVEWLGGSCQGSQQSSTYNNICELTQAGQVVVGNPTSFGFGSSSNITVLITEVER